MGAGGGKVVTKPLHKTIQHTRNIDITAPGFIYSEVMECKMGIFDLHFACLTFQPIGNSIMGIRVQDPVFDA